MKNLLLLVVLLSAAATASAHEVASVDSTSSDTVKYWILEDVK